MTELSCAQASVEIIYLRQQSENYNKPPEAYYETAGKITRRRLMASGLTARIDSNISGEVLTLTGTANSANVFGSLLGAKTVPVGVTRKCSLARPAGGSGGPGSLLFMESFETDHNFRMNYWGVVQNWRGWDTLGRGIEINGQPSLSAGTIRFGNFFAELDSYDNSTMSRTLQLQKGDYEIRYWYISRVRNPDPAWAGVVACGAGAVLEPYRAWKEETNRIDVYVEKSGNYTFAARDIVDSCVYTDQWVERVVKFTVTDPSEYRISWRASGKQDTVGGLIDYIRVCNRTCP